MWPVKRQSNNKDWCWKDSKKYKHWHFRNCFALVPSCWDCCAPSLILLLFCTCALSLIWFESETTPTRVALSGLVLSPLKGSFHLSGGKNKAVFFSFLFHITFFWFDLELSRLWRTAFVLKNSHLFIHPQQHVYKLLPNSPFITIVAVQWTRPEFINSNSAYFSVFFLLLFFFL